MSLTEIKMTIFKGISYLSPIHISAEIPYTYHSIIRKHRATVQTQYRKKVKFKIHHLSMLSGVGHVHCHFCVFTISNIIAEMLVYKSMCIITFSCCC